MKIFDFDGTIYRGDSTVDFWRYCITENPRCLIALPAQISAALKFAAHKTSTDEFKQTFYSFLKFVDNVDDLVESFWAKAANKFNDGVVEKSSPGDLVISASPEFLLETPCKALGMELIASKVDRKTGVLESKNCKGEEKVKRLTESEYSGPFEELYTDSISDAPLANLAIRSYMVTKKGIGSFNLL